MAPDKHQLKFNIHKDAKTLMEAIKKRFCGNKETKKVQKTLLKQQYKKFSGSNYESLDQIHDRLQKLINLEEQSLNDLFKSLKIYEAEVKSSSSSSTSTQNIAFVSSNTDITNEPVSAVASIFVASAKIPFSALPNCDGVGTYDWSFKKEEEPTNYALMAFTSSSSPSSDNEPSEKVKPHRPYVKPVEDSILAANHKTTIPKPKSHGNIRNRKACFACMRLTHLIKDCNYYEKKIAQTPAKNHAQIGNHQQYARMTLLNPKRHVVPIAVLTKSELVPITATRQVIAVVPKPHVTRPRQAKTIITKPHSPPRRHINHSPSPKASNFPPKVTTVKAPMGNPQHVLKEKEVIDSGCSRHMTGNMSYLSDFEEINGGYVAFGGNLKGDTKCIVLSPEFKLPDENQVQLRVLKGNNMYNVDLKNIVPTGDLTCLFAKETLDESTLWHRRLGHIYFKTMNKLVKDSLSKFNGKVDEGFLVGYFEPESKVYVSPSSSAQTKKHDYKTNREDKGKIHVESSTRYRNLSAEFEDFSNNSINDVNAANTSVPVVRKIFTNSTNTFSVASPSNSIV
nr:ribonuclease H-like domain-containing protein [Tanacetum cinerariifolium]